MKNTKDLCAIFIEAINPIAMKSDADRAIIYGEHEDDLANANFLMSVDSGKSVQDSYAIVAKEALKARNARCYKCSRKIRISTRVC